MAERIAWGRLMRLGLGRLGLRPAEFWALTPAELLTMAGIENGGQGMGRAALDALAARYPDKAKDAEGSDG
jgi:uncharacterized phage protein (TIGR02216 family)